MKNKLWKIGLCVSLFIGGFFVTTYWDAISDFVYLIPYNSSHHRFVVTNNVPENIEKNLQNAYPSGAMEMNDKEYAFSYASGYDIVSNKYYYRFENYGKKNFCVRSRIFAPLFGVTRIALSPSEIKYFVIISDAWATTQNALIHLQENCSWYAYGGTTITLIVPNSK